MAWQFSTDFSSGDAGLISSIYMVTHNCMKLQSYKIKHSLLDSVAPGTKVLPTYN